MPSTEKVGRILIHRLLSTTNVTRIQSSNKAHSLARSSTGRWGMEYLPSMMLASRQSSAYLQLAADSLKDHFALRRGSSWMSSNPGSSRPTCYLKTCSRHAKVVAVVVVAKSWWDERRPPSLVGLESGWDSVISFAR
jgi:hypothetical protein